MIPFSQYASDHNDRNFAAPVTPPTLPQRSCLSGGADLPRSRSSSSSSSCGSTRRVIFPSLHLTAEYPDSQEMSASILRSSAPQPVSPLTPDSSSAPSQPTASRNSTAFPTLSPAEREELLSKLDAVLPLPPIQQSTSCPVKNSMMSNSGAKASLTASTTSHRREPCKSMADVSSVSPLKTMDVQEDRSMFSFSRLGFPSRELQFSNSWCLKPRNERLDKSFDNKPVTPPPSILRKTSMSPKVRMLASTSESSDLPSLASSDSCDSIEDDDSNRVSFNPQVWVRLFVRSKREREQIWYSPEDMEQFKMEALGRIQQYYASGPTSSVLPTGTGRVVKVASVPPTKLLFTHQALREEISEAGVVSFSSLPSSAPSPSASCAMTTAPASLPPTVQQVARREIRKILLVDPHEICLQLFAKAFRLLQPYIIIRTASNSAAALALIAEESDFDIVLIEERLQRQGMSQDLLGSGALLLGGILGELTSKTSSPESLPLLIGVTSQLPRDQERFEKQGADVVWSKPPPSMTGGLQRDLLSLLLTKRGKSQLAESLRC